MSYNISEMIRYLRSSNNTFSPYIVRKDFPILNRQIHNKQLIYFDNAATAQKPLKVINSEKEFYENLNSNIHRGVHFLSEQATLAYESARMSVREFINAKKSKEIIFVKGATEAINLAAYSYGRNHIKEGDEVLISAMEHHANIVPWQVICEEKGASLKIIPMSTTGELLIEEFEKLLTERTKLVSVVHVSNSLGTINPVKEIIKRAHLKGIPVLIDGSQAIPHFKIDVQDLDCDFYTFSGHKLYGPTGIGVLYGKEQLLEEMPPYQTGGDMIERVTFLKTTYNTLPYKFEAGTQNIAGAIGLESAMNYLTSLDQESASKHEHSLLNYAQSSLQDISGLRIIGIAKNKAPLISFTLENVHPHDIGTVLDNEAIAIRTGHHCTQPVMDFFNVPATARVSFAFYNMTEEIDVLLSVVKKLVSRQSVSLFNAGGSDPDNDKFQAKINEHNDHAANYGECAICNHSEDGFNPFCGDHLILHVLLNGSQIEELKFEGELCAISKSSASMMTCALKGKTIKDAEKMLKNFNKMIEGGEVDQTNIESCGDLDVFSAIKNSPARVKCALLPWKTMKKVLSKEEILA